MPVAAALLVSDQPWGQTLSGVVIDGAASACWLSEDAWGLTHRSSDDQQSGIQLRRSYRQNGVELDEC